MQEVYKYEKSIPLLFLVPFILTQSFLGTIQGSIQKARVELWIEATSMLVIISVTSSLLYLSLIIRDKVRSNWTTMRGFLDFAQFMTLILSFTYLQMITISVFTVTKTHDVSLLVFYFYFVEFIYFIITVSYAYYGVPYFLKKLKEALKRRSHRFKYFTEIERLLAGFSGNVKSLKEGMRGLRKFRVGRPGESHPVEVHAMLLILRMEEIEKTKANLRPGVQIGICGVCNQPCLSILQFHQSCLYKQVIGTSTWNGNDIHSFFQP